MMFSIDRPIPPNVMYVLIAVQVKSARFTAAAQHQFHRVSPVGGVGELSLHNDSLHVKECRSSWIENKVSKVN